MANMIYKCAVIFSASLTPCMHADMNVIKLVRDDEGYISLPLPFVNDSTKL